jgi:spore photoproduct lyase
VFHRIFVESDIQSLALVESMLRHFSDVPRLVIDSYESYWAQVSKPYLSKRDKLNLFIARKRGKKVKPAPQAYGLSGEPHYYYIHFFNCIYECQYCYLQGYFHNPDLVAFVNHEEIIKEMELTLAHHEGQKVWFHAGEFSDSLALSHVTGELPLYHDFFRRHPRALGELRTKSANIRALRDLSPIENLFVSFSLSPASTIKKWDLKTPGLSARLSAIQELIQRGFQVAIHFDPIVYQPEVERDYSELFQTLLDRGVLTRSAYISLGVVRFTPDVYRKVQTHYPGSDLLDGPFQKGGDLIRYPYMMRQSLLLQLKKKLLDMGVLPEQIYLCME